MVKRKTRSFQPLVEMGKPRFYSCARPVQKGRVVHPFAVLSKKVGRIQSNMDQRVIQVVHRHAVLAHFHTEGYLHGILEPLIEADFFEKRYRNEELLVAEVVIEGLPAPVRRHCSRRCHIPVQQELRGLSGGSAR